MPTRLQLARSDIVRLLSKSDRCVYGQRELERILSEHRHEWRLAAGTSFTEFLKYLLAGRKLKRIELGFPHRKEVRYTWGIVPLEAVLMTLKRDCYFSHSTAMQLHELTEQAPTTVYLNHEQRPKPPPQSGLAQERIDLAFRRKPRTTRNQAVIKAADRKTVRVCLLNGKHTGYLGIEERDFRLPSQKRSFRVRLTDLERTLIDIAVRPFYAGGVPEVLKAYERSAGHASVSRLAATLRKIGYVYPYHQAIGFYLEAAGFNKRSVDLFYERFDYEFDFYLTYGMQESEYVPRWRIHVPPGLAGGRAFAISPQTSTTKSK